MRIAYPGILFPLLGVATAIVSWWVLGLVSAAPNTAGDVPVVKLWIGADEEAPVPPDSEMGIAEYLKTQFDRYCRTRGWGRTDLRITSTVGDFNQKYLASTIAGEGADVVSMGSRQLQFFAEHGLIEPLDAYIETWEDYREGRINKKVLGMCRGRDGTILGISFARAGPAFFAIRRDWLDTLGLAAPETFDEAYEVWKAFTFDDPDGNGIDDTHGYAITMKIERGGHVHRLTPFFLAAGIDWYGVDERGSIVPTFNTPEAAKLLRFIKRCLGEGLFGKDVMVNSGELPPPWRLFSDQLAGMCGGYRPAYFKSLALQYGMVDKVAVVPFLWVDESSRQQRRYAVDADLLTVTCIMRDSRNKAAAWRYLEFAFSKVRLGEEVSRQGGGIVRSRYLGRFGLHAGEPHWLSIRHDLTPQIQLDPDLEQAVRPLDAFVVRRPYSGAWTRAAQAMAAVFVDYYLGRGDLTAQQALDEAEQRFVAIHTAYERRLDGGAGR